MTRMEAILEVLRDGKAYKADELAFESRQLATENDVVLGITKDQFGVAFQILREQELIAKDESGNRWMGTNTF